VVWPRQYQELHDPATADPGTPLLDLLNIRYLVLSQPIEAVYPQAQLQKFQLVYDGSVKIYENLAVMPRAWIAHEAVSLPEAATLDYMRANAPILGSVVVVNEPLLGRTAVGVADMGTVAITRYENTEVVLQASMPTAGWLVLADTYFPGWRATIDGRSTDIARADYVYRAVWVPAGEHEVRFTYAPSTVRLGAIGSLLALLATLGLLVTGAMRWRNAREHGRGA
jgi:hypothetical protein